MSRRARWLGIIALVAIVGVGVGLFFYPKQPQPQPDATPNANSTPVAQSPIVPDRAARLAEVIALANKAVIGSPTERAAAVEQLKSIRQEDWGLLLEVGKEASEPATELIARLYAEEGPAVVDRLAEKLARDDRTPIRVSSYCVRALGKQSLEPVCKHAASSSVQVRMWVATCLAFFPHQPKVVLPVIEQFVGDSDERVIAPALRAIHGHTPQAGTLTEKVRAATKDPRAAVRNEAILALSHLEWGSSPDAQTFRDIRSADTPLDQRLRLIETLQKRKATPEMFEVLRDCLSDPKPEIQRTTLFLLQGLGTQICTVAPKLLEMAKAEKPVDIGMVLTLLGRCPPMPKELEPVAVKYLKSKRLSERRGALLCLVGATTLDETTITLIIDSLKEQDMSIRIQAVKALERFAARNDVMQALKKVSEQDPNPNIRAMAAGMILPKK